MIISNVNALPYHSEFKKITGNFAGGILLAKLLKDFERKDELGYSDEYLCKELDFTPHEIRIAKIAIKKNVRAISVYTRTKPRVTMYKIDREAIGDELSNAIMSIQSWKAEWAKGDSIC